MIKQLNLTLPPEVAYNEEALKRYISTKISSAHQEDFTLRKLKRSIDARGQKIKIHLQAQVYINEPIPPLTEYKLDYPDVSKATPVVIVGAGPGGLFAALRLIELGYKPIVIERGKDVQARRRDLASINKDHLVNGESNYCFGEGGAGTYSDGKLYTRSKKRGSVRRILEILVAHGAVEDILVDTHPHIGTNKLPRIVANLRESILQAGGEVHFDTKVIDFILKEGEMKGVITEGGDHIEGIGVILATGHSARDIFMQLHQRDIYIEAKPFALGVRIEHPQQLIDQIQYNLADRGEYLPASSYSLAAQVKHQGKQRGVFSFCMCPGGFIVPAATASGEVVVNGMSPSRRNSKFANSGMVVSVVEEDLKPYEKHGPLAGMYFQQEIEQRSCHIAGSTQTAPGQKMLDFVQHKSSAQLLETSYQPGLLSVSMDEVLPPFISQSLRKGFQWFGKKMKGYLTNEAQIVGVESRTSSPVRIPRDKDTFEHVQMKRLYPCAEGAGYAGGIMSAAIDGEKCAEKLIEKYG